MSNYLIQGETLTAIADKVRSKLGDTELITPEDMPAAVDEVYEKGKKAEYDRFWDAFQKNGIITSYPNAFAYDRWTDECYNPKYPILSNGCNQLFYNNTKITDTKVEIDVTNASQAFYLFQGCKNLVTIRKLKVASSQGWTNMFAGCTSLENITIEGTISKNFDISSATKLSKASITNIFNCLSTTTSGLTVTFSAEAINNALTSAEWDDFIYSHPNWNIATIAED